tara:strand:+ start:475 stop:1218 length:744 start_codon:yes stop_codon:yes gene_type:complete
MDQHDLHIMEIALEAIQPLAIDPPKELLDSMDACGQLEPIILNNSRRIDDHIIGEGEYQIDNGRRRVAAARALDWPSLYAIVVSNSEEDSAVTTLVTNNVRTRNFGHEAQAVETLIAKGYSVDKIAEMASMSVGMVQQLADMQKVLVPEIFTRVKNNTIKASAAKKLMHLPQEDQAAFASEERIRVKDVQASVNQHNKTLLNLDTVTVPTMGREADLADELESYVNKAAGDSRKALIDTVTWLREIA